MQSRKTLIGLSALAGLATLLVGGVSLRNAQAKETDKQPAPACKITPVQAIGIALKKVPGRPLQANFEFDEGHWVYGVMIVSGKTIKEVEIDPMNGKVGGTETVTPEDEAKEMRDSLTKAIGGKVQAEKEEKEEKDEKPEKPEKP